MQPFSEIQKDPKLESNENGGKYVEIANCVVIFRQCTNVNTKYVSLYLLYVHI